MVAMMISYYWTDQGQGEIIIATIADPAAGNQFLPYTLPANYNYKVTAIAFQLVAGAATINRYCCIDITPAGGVTCPQVQSYPMSQTGRTYEPHWGIGAPDGGQWNTATRSVYSSGLLNAFLPPGTTIGPYVDALQADDQLQNYAMVLQRWIIQT